MSIASTSFSIKTQAWGPITALEKDPVPGSHSQDRKINLRYPTAGQDQGEQASYAGVNMKKKRNTDPLISQIERALDLGQFISYNQSWDFVHDLEDIKDKIDDLTEGGEADRAVRLYELFLSGCYEKVEEIDDSGGNLGMFFQDLFLSWIKARQEAGHAAEETVGDILNWMENDGYGFCYDMEKELAKVLNKAGFVLFRQHFQDRFEEAFAPFESKKSRFIFDYPADVYLSTNTLKDIYVVKKDVKAYLALCGKVGITPTDCEHIASLQEAKRRYDDALTWAEKGLKLEKEREWGNQSSYQLTGIRQELLNKLGRREDALESAWAEFIEYPSDIGYDRLRKYIPKEDFRHWHEKAIQEAKKSSLSAFIEICTATKEWEVLSEHIVDIGDDKLEKIGHYTTEKAARGLAKKHSQAAAKIYAALGMRIVRKGKSKYYHYALEHFRNARKLYEKAGCDQMWLSLVDSVRKDHSRKYSFIGGFEEIAAGKHPEHRESFEKRAQKRWKKQTSR
jgi:tetratricopeptide (TPR) repeat protein